MEVHVVNIIVHLQRVCVYNPPLADAHREESRVKHWLEYFIAAVAIKRHD